MEEIRFEPRLRSDGTFDPACLECMGQDWLTAWMRDRLSGRDRHFPLDPRADEDPEALLVGWVRSLGTVHPLSALLSEAARRLLDEALTMAPETPAFFAPLLRLCQRVPLPQTVGWFLDALKVAAERPEEFTARWPELGRRNEILFAALRQTPGWPGYPAQPAWKALLARPESTTFALSALGPSLEQQLPYLAAWWRTCPEDERDLELEQFIFEVLNSEGKNGAREFLQKGPKLPGDLKAAIDRTLRSLGSAPCFSEPHRSSAVTHAGWKPEFLLPAMSEAA